MAKAATPWGQAELVEELALAQRAGDKRFSSVVQLLQAPGGERLVRFAYTTGGSARRGPVTLRQRDLERLRAGWRSGQGSRRRSTSGRREQSLGGGVDQRAEDHGAIGGAEERVDRVLGVRHQAEDRLRLVGDARDRATDPFGLSS
jgi:hypothetical protein